MNNLSRPSNYEPEPNAINTSIQKGGRRYRHKKGCRCFLCKKRGGAENYDIETGPPQEESYKIDIKDEHDIESGPTSTSKDNDSSSNLETKNDFNFASKEDYDELDALDQAEKGFSEPIKGGTRRRKRNNSKKMKKRHSRKTRRNKHKRKTTFRRGKL
jgi:hypothetical protein